MRKTAHLSHRLFSAVLSVICCAAMLVPSAVIPAAALTVEPSGAAEFALAESDAPDVTEVTTEAQLNSLLISSGDVNIKLKNDISVTFIDDRPIRYSIGAGRKVIDLDGYSISVDAQYYYTADGYVGGESQSLFGLPVGSELVVNDSSVLIAAGSPKIESGGIYFTNSEVRASDCFSERHLFFIIGGALTINSGNFTAGNVKKVGSSSCHLMANGSAVVMSSGSFTLNGGTLTGYGGNGTDYDDSWKTGNVLWTRNGVVTIGDGCLDNCTININGGVINGYGCSSAFCLDTLPDTTIQGESDLIDSSRVSVKACKINLDYYKDVVVELGAYTPSLGATRDRYWVLHPGNGRVGLNVKLDENTECYMGSEKVNDKTTPFYSTSSMVIQPKSEIGQVSVSYLDGNMWDVLSPYRFEITFPKDYFPLLSDDDLVRSDERYAEYELVDEYGNSVAKFTDKIKDDGSPLTIDLRERLNDEQKDKLIQGNFYYFKVTKVETREGKSAYYKITSPDKEHEDSAVILIKEPEKIENVNAVITAPRVGSVISSEISQEGCEDICEVRFEGWYIENERLPESAVFQYDTVYEARVRYIPKDNHKFSDTAKLTINGKEAQFMQKSADGSILMSAVYGIERDVIYYVNCAVDRPSAGKNPPTTAVPEDEEYTVESVEVYESAPPYKSLSPTDVCEHSTEYTVCIRVKAKEGMRFSDDTTFCVNNYTANAVTIAGGSASAIIDKNFTTSKAHLDIASVTTENSVIKEGDTAYTPEFVSDEPSDYEVSFRNWLDYTAAENGDILYLSEGDSFETGKTYNLNVTLRPKSDKYDIDTHTALSINGVDAKFSYFDSAKQEYYYSLPMVCRKVISNAYCTVTEPKAGETPVFTADSADPTMYSVGYVDFSYIKDGTETHMGSDYTFQEGRQYRVYVEFEPTDEYLFADDANFYINGVIAKKYYSKRFRVFYVGDCVHETKHWDRLEPTCSYEGHIEYWQCDICGKKFSDEACTKEITGSVLLDKLPHTPGEPVKENETWFTYDSVIYCKVCGEELSREWVATSGPTHEHKAGEEHKENEIAATCTKEGSYDLVIRCTECDDIMAIAHVETEKLPHTPGEVKKENDTGSEWDDVTYCTECGKELTRIHQTKEHTHTPSEAVKENEKVPTCTHEGSYDEVIKCTECGEEISRKTVTVKRLPHTPGETVKENEVAATCTQEGSYDEVVKCAVCGEEISRNTVKTEKLAHTPGEKVRENEDENGYDEVVKCTVCGEEISKIHVDKTARKGIYGDVDRDGTITANDALMILRQSVTMEHFDSELILIADVDDDGEVTANDALAVLRYSVGMDDGGNVGKEIA